MSFTTVEIKQIIDERKAGQQKLSKLYTDKYPLHNVDHFDTMMEWTKYPTIGDIDIKELMNIAADYMEHKFNEEFKGKVVAQHQFDLHTGTVAAVRNGQMLKFCHCAGVCSCVTTNSNYIVYGQYAVLKPFISWSHLTERAYGMIVEKIQWIHIDPYLIDTIILADIYSSIEGPPIDTFDFNQRLFDFESDNGDMRKQLHDAKQVNLQLSKIVDSLSKEIVNQKIQQTESMETFDDLNAKLTERIAVLESNDISNKVKQLTDSNICLLKDIESMRTPKHRFIELNDKLKQLAEVSTFLRRDIESMRTPKHRYVELNDKLKQLADTITDLKSQASISFEELRDEFKNATKPSHEFIKRVEYMPVYDYVLIKSRNRILHNEFRMTYRFFKQILQMKYNTPIAVAVMK